MPKIYLGYFLWCLLFFLVTSPASILIIIYEGQSRQQSMLKPAKENVHLKECSCFHPELWIIFLEYLCLTVHVIFFLKLLLIKENVTAAFDIFC